MVDCRIKLSGLAKVGKVSCALLPALIGEEQFVQCRRQLQRLS